MSEQSNNNKRIAKNTLLLYFRMLFLMCVSLYTSRFVLQALGVTDYGIYNVVGGFVSFFSLISAALTSACTRFINFEMGKGKIERLNLVFSTSLTVHIILAVLIACLCESIGIWYLNNKMVIPVNRLEIANWVFQFSILTFCCQLITVPYNASIIAHEKMSAFAHVSIFEGIAKLAVCFVVLYSSYDHLLLYAVLIMTIQLSVMSIYRIYCKRKFVECKYKIQWDKPLLKQMLSYSGWHVFGNSASVLNKQGVDLVLNYFCGPVLNAAKGISNQVMNAVAGFANNFMMAMNPQITQSYAKEDYDYMFSLIYRGSRFSYYLLLILSLPIILNAEYIMNIWLTTVPDYAVSLAQLALISSMIASISNPLVTAQNATGNVKNYQIVVGGLQLANLPICFTCLYLGASPISVLIVSICVEIVSLIARLIMILHYVKHFSTISFIREVIIKIVVVTAVACIVPVLVSLKLEDTFVNFCIKIFVCVLFSSISIFYLGCSTSERSLLITQVKKIKNKIIH